VSAGARMRKHLVLRNVSPTGNRKRRGGKSGIAKRRPVVSSSWPHRWRRVWKRDEGGEGLGKHTAALMSIIPPGARKSQMRGEGKRRGKGGDQAATSIVRGSNSPRSLPWATIKEGGKGKERGGGGKKKKKEDPSSRSRLPFC